MLAMTRLRAHNVRCVSKLMAHNVIYGQIEGSQCKMRD